MQENKASIEQQNDSSADEKEELLAKINLMEKFIARRFDEISMEINATAQQLDMAEDGIVNRFVEILEILNAISYSGSGDTAANSGVELEAVIEDTENAANQILDAADRISDYLEEDKDWMDPEKRESLRDRIRNDIQEILLACTFQDLTGQRIRKTLDNLHQIENRISSTFEKLGVEIQINEDELAEKVVKASNQDEIDNIIQGMAGDDASQDDIDKILNGESD